mmetsp:Transcript_7138/g.12460  ORF Transcript_7138/g.12460 Transcript_7138/m.12460 type:complete len:205 (-) Transcript_7138:36-650(-)
MVKAGPVLLVPVGDQVVPDRKHADLGKAKCPQRAGKFSKCRLREGIHSAPQPPKAVIASWMAGAVQITLLLWTSLPNSTTETPSAGPEASTTGGRLSMPDKSCIFSRRRPAETAASQTLPLHATTSATSPCGSLTPLPFCSLTTCAAWSSTFAAAALLIVAAASAKLLALHSTLFLCKDTRHTSSPSFPPSSVKAGGRSDPVSS